MAMGKKILFLFLLVFSIQKQVFCSMPQALQSLREKIVGLKGSTTGLAQGLGTISARLQSLQQQLQGLKDNINKPGEHSSSMPSGENGSFGEPEEPKPLTPIEVNETVEKYLNMYRDYAKTYGVIIPDLSNQEILTGELKNWTKAYKSLSRRLHPDKIADDLKSSFPDQDWSAIFQAINGANEQIKKMVESKKETTIIPDLLQALTQEDASAEIVQKFFSLIFNFPVKEPSPKDIFDCSAPGFVIGNHEENEFRVLDLFNMAESPYVKFVIDLCTNFVLEMSEDMLNTKAIRDSSNFQLNKKLLGDLFLQPDIQKLKKTGAFIFFNNIFRHTREMYKISFILICIQDTLSYNVLKNIIGIEDEFNKNETLKFALSTIESISKSAEFYGINLYLSAIIQYLITIEDRDYFLNDALPKIFGLIEYSSKEQPASSWGARLRYALIEKFEKLNIAFKELLLHINFDQFKEVCLSKGFLRDLRLILVTDVEHKEINSIYDGLTEFKTVVKNLKDALFSFSENKDMAQLIQTITMSVTDYGDATLQKFLLNSLLENIKDCMPGYNSFFAAIIAKSFALIPADTITEIIDGIRSNEKTLLTTLSAFDADLNVDGRAAAFEQLKKIKTYVAARDKFQNLLPKIALQDWVSWLNESLSKEMLEEFFIEYDSEGIGDYDKVEESIVEAVLDSFGDEKAPQKITFMMSLLQQVFDNYCAVKNYNDEKDDADWLKKNFKQQQEIVFDNKPINMVIQNKLIEDFLEQEKVAIAESSLEECLGRVEAAKEYLETTLFAVEKSQRAISDFIVKEILPAFDKYLQENQEINGKIKDLCSLILFYSATKGSINDNARCYFESSLINIVLNNIHSISSHLTNEQMSNLLPCLNILSTNVDSKNSQEYANLEAWKAYFQGALAAPEESTPAPEPAPEPTPAAAPDPAPVHIIPVPAPVEPDPTHAPVAPPAAAPVPEPVHIIPVPDPVATDPVATVPEPTHAPVAPHEVVIAPEATITEEQITTLAQALVDDPASAVQNQKDLLTRIEADKKEIGRLKDAIDEIIKTIKGIKQKTDKKAAIRNALEGAKLPNEKESKFKNLCAIFN